jgi:hypothetical protein
VSPTVFRDGPYRFYFFSREERRIHVHVQCPEGEAKFWLEPRVALAQNSGLNLRQLHAVQVLIEAHADEIGS